MRKRTIKGMEGVIRQAGKLDIRTLAPYFQRRVGRYKAELDRLRNPVVNMDSNLSIAK